MVKCPTKEGMKKNLPFVVEMETIYDLNQCQTPFKILLFEILGKGFGFNLQNQKLFTYY